MCQFYGERRQPDASRTLAQYISLALYLNGPPAPFSLKSRSGYSPDANYTVGIRRCWQKFYDAAGLHAIWEHIGKPIRS